ncbi:hypothetical protein IF608_003257 [Shigella sonnei]|nr:hypothetical protein [Salmonella enterica]ECH8370280.1 hypothetical protein [Salmonella enterica subsp. enterica serovar Agona]EDW9513985.1 hypothetical protein [Salmonella enterica subsp. enterica serovar Albany]EEI9259687.1 hypothetical protein [Salmonella enterica subsp. enterica serovar Typhimurium var. 5-]EEM1258625.1 hypothetical protein [Salmonella enterica subsp. enterica serovar Typhimurium]EFM7893431.1 hypothetical protein [Escherichia coli]EFP4119376.1 hypothetical protein [Shig
MAQVNMSLRIDAELKDAFMAAAKSMDRNGSQLIRDFMRQTVERQHNTWFTYRKLKNQSIPLSTPYAT